MQNNDGLTLFAEMEVKKRLLEIDEEFCNIVEFAKKTNSLYLLDCLAFSARKYRETLEKIQEIKNEEEN